MVTTRPPPPSLPPSRHIPHTQTPIEVRDTYVLSFLVIAFQPTAFFSSQTGCSAAVKGSNVHSMRAYPARYVRAYKARTYTIAAQQKDRIHVPTRAGFLHGAGALVRSQSGVKPRPWTVLQGVRPSAGSCTLSLRISTDTVQNHAKA